MSEHEVCDARADRSGWDEKPRILYDYWLSRTKPGVLPGRQHVDPLEIPRLLPWIFMHDIERDPFRVRCRLTGTAVVDYLGVDPTGKWFDEVHASSPVLMHMLSLFERIAESGEAIRRRGRAAAFNGRNYLRVENVIVPLSRDGVAVDMTMGVISITKLPRPF